MGWASYLEDTSLRQAEAELSSKAFGRPSRTSPSPWHAEMDRSSEAFVSPAPTSPMEFSPALTTAHESSAKLAVIGVAVFLMTFLVGLVIVFSLPPPHRPDASANPPSPQLKNQGNLP